MGKRIEGRPSMIKEILEGKDAKDAFDDMFKDSMKDLEDISKLIDKAIKKKNVKPLDGLVQDLGKILQGMK